AGGGPRRPRPAHSAWPPFPKDPRMRHLALLAAAAVALSPPATSAGPLPVGVTVVGDSISDPYAHYHGALNPATPLPCCGQGGDKTWAEQVLAARGPGVTLFNYGVAGATTGDLLTNGSADQAALRVTDAGVRRGVVIAGANDVLAFLQGAYGGDPAAFVAAVA